MSKEPKHSVKLFGMHHSIEYIPAALKALSQLNEDSVLGLERHDLTLALFRAINGDAKPERELRRVALLESGIPMSPKSSKLSDQQVAEHIETIRGSGVRAKFESFIFFYRLYAFARERNAQVVSLFNLSLEPRRQRLLHRAEFEALRGHPDEAKRLFREHDFLSEQIMAEGIAEQRVTDAAIGAFHVKGISGDLLNRGIRVRSQFLKPRHPSHAEGLPRLLRETEPHRPESQKRPRKPRK